ncbi:hypothetical protein PanWU01x14_223890 [Parasponia andersonii]|uniref:Ethylene-responsive nuclear protein n=1 Tax=Parasponia andersonii TaxID=3476 RepID=A0A2P5BNG1_PARAD|nr:hypothetical protein PanWU01x14_223890 [Parasponia andersonii]
MPLPWKKAKVTRISRIVADLQSPKRGGSLVVQTGFPTSLIDLFVKNRDRLKKPSRKKKKKNKAINDSSQADVRAPDPITASTYSGSDNSSVRVGPFCDEASNSTEQDGVESIGTSASETTTRDENRVEEEFVGGGVLMAILKVFLVVVLALSTKKLVVGITLSAFLLLFVEYVGKRSVRFLRPCSTMEVRLRSLMNWVFGFISFNKDVLVEEEEKRDNYVVMDELVDGSESKSYSNEEIEIFELNINESKEEFSSTGPELEFLSHDKKWSFLNTSKKEEKEAMDGCGEVLVLDKSKGSKRAKIKAKIIKNFVPKKLRGSNKGKKKSKDNNNEVEASSDVSSNFEPEEQEDQRSESRKDSVNGEISSLDEGLQSETELAIVSEEVEEEKGREERKGNWVYLTLVLIALAGLFGGRIIALLLTISWCLMLKLIGTTQGRLIERMAKSSFAISS